jgi:hypothetical protein
MISLVVLAVAIIGMLLLSQSAPQKIPNINFMTGYDANRSLLYLYHNGGDSLTQGTFSVVVNGTPTTNYIISDYSTEWSLGKNLIVSGVPAGKNSIAIVYNTTQGSPFVLRSATSDIVVPAGTPSSNPDYAPLSSYPPVISVPLLMQNVTNRSVNFYRENGTIIQSGSLQFTVTSYNSSVVYTPFASTTPNFLQLDNNSIVVISPDTAGWGMRVFATGNQIWELTSDKATLTVTNNGVNLPATPVKINHMWITGYRNFQSTVKISTAATIVPVYTELSSTVILTMSVPSYFTANTETQRIVKRL